jgi:hypothetical protein
MLYICKEIVGAQCKQKWRKQKALFLQGISCLDDGDGVARRD